MPMYMLTNGDFRANYYEKRVETFDEAAAFQAHLMNDVGHRHVLIVCCEESHERAP